MQRRQVQHRHPLSGALAVLVVFAKIGSTAFGGGSATIAAMRQACIRHGWMNEQQFLDIVVLSRLTPGISILAQTLLIGRAVAGVPGMFAGLAGLLTPALAITLALSKLYQFINGLPSTVTPLHAIVAASAGFAIAMTLQLLRDSFAGRRVVLTTAIVIAYTGLAFLVANPLMVMGIAVVLALLLPGLFIKLEKHPPEESSGERPEP